MLWLGMSELAVALALGFVGPSTTVMVAVLLVAPAALLLKADQLVIISLGSLFFTRLLVDYGAPSTLNYAHFALAVLALIKLLERPADESNTRLITWLFISLGVVLLSSALSSWQAFRPLLAWITLFEPFIFFGLVASLDQDTRDRLRVFLIAICIIQIPFCLMQFAANGPGDFVQGTLVGQGAGHHVMGAVTAMTGWLMIATAKQRTKGLMALAIGIFALGVLADAKQVYGVLVAAMVLMGLTQAKGLKAAKSLLLPAVLLVVAMFGIAQIYPPMQRVLTVDILEDAFNAKYEKVEQIVSEMGVSHAPLGLGAGNGISRTALSTVPGYGNVPTLLVGDDPAPMAVRELHGYDAVLISSVDSPFASWLGIYSDLGLLGIASFVALLVCMWRTLRAADEAHRRTSEVFIVFAAMLGIVFTWLEEPAFMVFLAVLLATGVRPSASTGLKGHSAALQSFSRSWSSVRRSL